MDRPNLVWLTIEYDPIILFSIEPVMKGLRMSLCHDMSHFHYFLESQFGLTNVRHSDFTTCKSLLKSRLEDPGLFFYMTKNTNPDIRGAVFVKQFKSFD